LGAGDRLHLHLPALFLFVRFLWPRARCLWLSAELERSGDWEKGGWSIVIGQIGQLLFGQFLTGQLLDKKLKRLAVENDTFDSRLY
jgi:hypothetical protein